MRINKINRLQRENRVERQKINANCNWEKQNKTKQRQLYLPVENQPNGSKHAAVTSGKFK